MNPKVKPYLRLGFWCILLVYIVFASRHCSHRTSGTRCSRLDIRITDSVDLGFLNTASVLEILDKNGISPMGRPLDSLNTIEVEQALAGDPYVKRAKVYVSFDGCLHVEIEQRIPVVRIQSDNGYRFYLCGEGTVMPMKPDFYPDVPVVTGRPELPFGKDYSGPIPETASGEKKSEKNTVFLRNLINFVKFLKKDPFWNSQIVQIHVVPGNELELITRVGDAVILLGAPEEYEEKLRKLYTFYRRGLAYEGWNKYRYINVKYRNQVVCTK